MCGAFPACCSSCPAALQPPLPPPHLPVSRMPFLLLPAPPVSPFPCVSSTPASLLRHWWLEDADSGSKPGCRLPAPVLSTLPSVTQIAFWKCFCFCFNFKCRSPTLLTLFNLIFFFSCSQTRCQWYSLLMRFTPSPLLSPTAMSTFPRGRTHLTSPPTSAPNKVRPSRPGRDAEQSSCPLCC